MPPGRRSSSAQALWAARLLRTALEDPHRAAFANLFAGRSLALIALGAAIAWTVIRAARARAAVGRLIGELRDAPAPLDLQGSLARAVGDPGLAVAYPIGDGARYVDAHGQPVDVPPAGGARAVTSIERDGAPVALVLHDPAALGEGDLAREIGAAAQLAVDNERLQAQSHAQLQDLRASRARVVETADAARRNLERDLHDGAQQRLVSLSLMLQLAADSLEPHVAAQIDAAESELRAATVELRELAHGIHPAALSEEGLGPAIRALADRVPLAIEALDLPTARLPPPVETAAYFLVDEVARGSKRTSVSLRADARTLTIELAAEAARRREAVARPRPHRRARRRARGRGRSRQRADPIHRAGRVGIALATPRACPVSDASIPIYRRRIVTERNGGAMRLKTAVAIGLVAVGGSATVPAVASGPKLGVRAARLDKVDPTTWTGKALSPQLGTGRLTLIGKITFTDTDADNPNGDTHVIRFRATFKKGWIRRLLRQHHRCCDPATGRCGTAPGASSPRRLRCAAIAASSSARAGGTPADDTTYAKPFGFSAQDRPGKPGC